MLPLYQAVTVEMVQRVRKACQVHLDHVVLKEKQVRRACQGHLGHVVLKEKRDQLERSLLNKETGNSARGKSMTAVILALLR